MVTTILSVLCALVIVLALIFPLGNTLHHHPWEFYAVGILIIGVYCGLLLAHTSLPVELKFLDAMIRRGHLSAILFAVVMFTGTFDEDSAIRHKLQPLRAELSILSFIFIIGHIFAYLQGYLPFFANMRSLKSNVAVSLAIAIALSLIFFLLAITSFKFVRSKMPHKIWKRLQRFSYAMVALLVLHVIFVFGSSITSFGQVTSSGIRTIVYLCVFATYAMLRLRKALHDQKKVIEKGGVSGSFGKNSV